MFYSSYCISPASLSKPALYFSRGTVCKQDRNVTTDSAQVGDSARTEQDGAQVGDSARTEQDGAQVGQRTGGLDSARGEFKKPGDLKVPRLFCSAKDWLFQKMCSHTALIFFVNEVRFTTLP